MTDNPEKSRDFSDNGIGLRDQDGVQIIWIGGGSLIPTNSPGLNAPSGSRYYHVSGVQYEKFGNLDTDWREAAGVGSPTASPGFTFGSGGNNSSALNQAGNVPSDITGIPNQLVNARAIQDVVDNQDQTDYTVEFFEHSGSLTNFNSIIQVVVTSPAIGGVVNIDIPLTTGKKIGCRIIAGSQKNGIGVLYVKGDAVAV